MPTDEDTERPLAMTKNQAAILAELAGVHATGDVGELDDTAPLTPEELAAFKASLNQLAEHLGGKTRGEAINQITDLADLAASYKLKKK